MNWSFFEKMSTPKKIDVQYRPPCQNKQRKIWGLQLYMVKEAFI